MCIGVVVVGIVGLVRRLQKTDMRESRRNHGRRRRDVVRRGWLDDGQRPRISGGLQLGLRGRCGGSRLCETFGDQALGKRAGIE